jgi:alanine-glyoxylate transaminase/(R)-3-amino-2-methylpropionate-pyruvate transaminase
MTGGKRSSLPETKHKPKAYSGPSFEEVLQHRKKFMPSLYFHYYKEPLLIYEGHGHYLWDHTGKRYLDLISGISTVSVGHSHPRISKVVKEQVDTLTHISPIYMQQYQGEYSKMLCEQLGPGFDNVFLTNSGAEANDFAILLARLYTNATKIISLRNGYHGLVGNTQGITNVGTWNQPTIRGIDHEKLAYPSSYRGLFKTTEDYIKDAEEALNSNTSGRVAGFVAEPIMGVGGISPLPKDYLKHMYTLIRKYGGLCIADEVQTGFGRVGKDFWGFRWSGVQPDIVTMAKGIGNGFPIGAVATRKEITDVVKKVYFNTFGGGPIQCRVGMEVLKIIKDEKLHENADTIGDYLMGRLKDIQSRSKILGDVRGKGLMIGAEIVKNKDTKEPCTENTNRIMEGTREAGLLFGKGGPFGNVIRIQPPLTITKADADYVADVMEKLLVV